MANDTTTVAVKPKLLSNDEFAHMVRHRMAPLLGVADYLGRCPLSTGAITRPLLGELLSESAQMTELFDGYGAKNNQTWRVLRHLLSSTKLFSRTCYSLLHIRHSLSSYHLLAIEGDAAAATEETLVFLSDVLLNLSAQLVREAQNRGICNSQPQLDPCRFEENLPEGRLPDNLKRREVNSSCETVAHLATALLNLGAESEALHVFKRVPAEEYGRCIPDPLSEETTRQLEHKFHNLQSLYDTYVSDTQTEHLDQDLPYLRGHITMVFHLLEVATDLTHYYERHCCNSGNDTTVFGMPIVDQGVLLRLLVEYPITFASRYLTRAVSLCQQMLRKYAEIGRITVPVPTYRGFHVRPSTLVAKICHHYGSEVKMELGGETYDASAPLDLFRANEYINASKRRALAEEIGKMPIANRRDLENGLAKAVTDIVQQLASKQKIVIYERPLPLEEMQPTEHATLAQFAVDEVARLLALGKIDIEADISVTFVGDKRVLNDLRVLAECGYGEDNFGNNIPLPKELGYLRR